MTSIAVDRPRARAKRGASTRRGSRHDGPDPWSRRDATVLGVLLAVVVGFLVFGWVGISDTVDLNSQTRWLGLGISALMVGGFAMVFWLLTGMQAVAVLRREVLAELDRQHPAAPLGVADWTVAPRDARHSFGTVPGMRRYHRASCRMLSGKDASFASIDAHAAAGLLPCGVCEPPPAGG